MSAWSEYLESEAEEVLDAKFDVRDGNVTPESGKVTASQAVKLEATFLYADLAGSSKLADACPWDTTAKLIRCYLDLATRSIKAWKGEVRSFDGDRVMAVFKGDAVETSAANCAREIDWSVSNILSPLAHKKFKSVRDASIQFRHGIGIATGTARAVRAGIRDNNDLIWIGRAPSFAAKLSDLRRHPYEVLICSTTYSRLSDTAKIEKSDRGTNVWEQDTFTFADKVYTVYKSKTTKTP